MKAKKLTMATVLVAPFLWCVSWAPLAHAAGVPQDSSPAAAPASSASAPSTTQNKSSAKEKHWNGNLVDVACMVKALESGAKAETPELSPPGTPHFAGSGQGAQAPAGPGATPNTGTPSTPTQYPNANTTSPQDQAREAQEARIDNATKQCTATPSTQNFGLVMSGGQVVQFDPQGNKQASEALKEARVEPGKKLKAKVSGTMENSTTVMVASVDIKVKGKKPSTE